METTTQITTKQDQITHLEEDNARLQRLAEHFEEKYKSARSSLGIAENMVKSWRNDFYTQREKANQVEPLKGRIAELEHEVLFLKARLWDMAQA